MEQHKNAGDEFDLAKRRIEVAREDFQTAQDEIETAEILLKEAETYIQQKKENQERNSGIRYGKTD